MKIRREATMKKLSQKDYVISKWSGGKTMQIAIYPAQANYADRDFLWRVSSATVELQESDFTSLPDYDRLIATLRGEILLTHNGGAPLPLGPFEVHAFSGADATHSTGCCTDFNLMLRRGMASGSMEPLRLTSDPCAFPTPCVGESVLLYCAEGVCVAQAHGENAQEVAPLSHRLAPGETLLLSVSDLLTLTGPAVLMVCRIKLVEEVQPACGGR